MNVSDILDELDDHGFTDASTARKLAVINQTLHDVCNARPWPFMEKEVTLTFNGTDPTPAGSGATPSDFHAVTAMFNDTLGGKEVSFMRRDNFLRRHVGDTSTGIPTYFYFIGTTLNFWPIPTSDQTVVMTYIARHSDLTETSLEADIRIPREYHRGLLVNGAVYKLDAMEDDTDISAWFQVEYNNTMAKMEDWCTRQQWQNVQIIQPVDADDLNGGAETATGFWYT